jgi:hypothetical protein
MWDPIIKTPTGTNSSLVFIECVSTPAMNFSISLRNTTKGPFFVSSVANCKGQKKKNRDSRSLEKKILYIMQAAKTNSKYIVCPIKN